MADQLSLPGSTAEIDPDADPFSTGPALVESDDELAAAALSMGCVASASWPAAVFARDPHLPSGISQSENFRLSLSTRVCSKGREKARLRGDILLEGVAYAGRRSSRAAVFGDQASGDEEAAAAGSSDENDEDLPTGSSSSEEGEAAAAGSSSDDEQLDDISTGAESDSEQEATAGDSDDEGPEALANGPPRGDGSEGVRGSEDEQGPSGGEDESGEDSGSGAAAAAAAAAASGEMAALEAEYAALQAADADAVAGLRERAERERLKALAVRAQRSLWQRGLELRILLQRALGGANRLPRPAGHAAVSAASPELAQALAGLAADAAETVEALAGLLDVLVGQNPALAEAAVAAGAPAAAVAGDKRQREEQDQEEEREARGGKAVRLWTRLDEGHARLAPFRDASIDRRVGWRDGYSSATAANDCMPDHLVSPAGGTARRR